MPLSPTVFLGVRWSILPIVLLPGVAAVRGELMPSLGVVDCFSLVFALFLPLLVPPIVLSLPRLSHPHAWLLPLGLPPPHVEPCVPPSPPRGLLCSDLLLRCWLPLPLLRVAF